MAIGPQDISFEIQVNAEQKSLIEAAAALSGQPISAFTVSATVDTARRLVGGQRTIQLSPRDWDRFLNLLDNPAEPTEDLKRAVARFRDDVIT